MVAAAAQPTITKEVTIPAADYNEFLHFKPSSSATFAQSGNHVAFFSTSSSLGPWILDYGVSNHMTGNNFFISLILS